MLKRDECVFCSALTYEVWDIAVMVWHIAVMVGKSSAFVQPEIDFLSSYQVDLSLP